MKRIISLTVWLVFLAWSIGFAQTAVRTETASNKYVSRQTATTGDTIFTSATSIASGSAIRNYNTQGFIVGIDVGEPVASDTIIIKNGVDTVTSFVQPSSAPFIYSKPLNIRLDTSLIVIQKKASKSAVIFRLRY